MIASLENWKTTLTGVVGAIALVLAQLDIIHLNENTQDSIVIVVFLVLSILAGDGKEKNLIGENK